MLRTIKLLRSLTFSSILLMVFFSVPVKSETTFNSIEVFGNYRIETSTILSYADVPLNISLTDSELNEVLQRLVASKLFQDVKIESDNRTLNIFVTEFPMINTISIEGNERLTDEQLLDLISSEPLKVYSAKIAESDAERLAGAYSSVGRITAEVKPFIIRRSDNRVDLVFEVFEGKIIEIKRLSFIGNVNFSDNRLRRVLGTKQAGLLRRFKSNDVFSKDRIEFDKQLLRDFYASRGYIDFELLSVTSALTRQRDGFFVTFKINEGYSFKLGDLSLNSDLEEIDVEEYLPILKLKSGMMFSPVLIDQAINRLESLASEKGFSFIRILPDIKRNDQTRTLDINFKFVRGERIFVERLSLVGNTTTMDRVIRQQFDTVEGDPFNPREIRAAAARINALRFFEPLDLKTRPGSDDQKIVLDVNVKEVPTGNLTFGVAYGETTGFGGSMTVSQRNLLGRGQALSFGFDSSANSKNLNLSFLEPNFLRRDLGFKVNLYNTTTNNQYAYYDTDQYGFSPGFSFPVSRYGNGSFSFTHGGQSISNLSTNSSKVLKNEASARSSSKIGISYKFDTRKKGINPDAGVHLSLSQDYSGFGGSNQYLKTNALIGGEIEILSGNLTLMAEAEAGRIQSLSGTTSVLDRYFAGYGSIRGFEPKGLGPRDLTAVNQDALGGNLYSAARLEARFPIGFLEDSGISGGTFYDIGSVWNLDSTDGSSGLVDDSLSLRSSLGFSIFWKTVIGPLRINYTSPLLRKSYDRIRMLDLSVTSQF